MRDEVCRQPATLRALLGELQPGLLPDQLRSFNRIVGTAPRATIRLGAGSAALRLARPGAGPEAGLCKVTLAADGLTLDLFFPDDLVQALYAGRVAFDDPDDGLIGILARHALSGGVKALSARLGKPVSMTFERVQGPVRQITLPVELRLDREAEARLVHLGGDFARIVRLLPLCDLSSADGPGPGIALDVRISSPPASLPRAEAANIAVGDLLFLAGRPLTEFLVLSCRERPLAHVSLENGACRITKSMEQTDMTETDHPGDPEVARPAPGDLSATEVELTVEVGETHMPLKQAQSLREGMLVDLGQMDTELASLRINGRIAARGSLVGVGDGVGFRITSVIPDGR